mmetsp:Transcript_2196/g.6535  ORF Transcript_2196/g.6535 Transcript_2196/m.6535 type:complete len:278 (+) Transcript_2196:163-996(+)
MLNTLPQIGHFLLRADTRSSTHWRLKRCPHLSRTTSFGWSVFTEQFLSLRYSRNSSSVENSELLVSLASLRFSSFRFRMFIWSSRDFTLNFSCSISAASEAALFWAAAFAVLSSSISEFVPRRFLLASSITSACFPSLASRRRTSSCANVATFSDSAVSFFDAVDRACRDLFCSFSARSLTCRAFPSSLRLISCCRRLSFCPSTAAREFDRSSTLLLISSLSFSTELISAIIASISSYRLSALPLAALSSSRRRWTSSSLDNFSSDASLAVASSSFF